MMINNEIIIIKLINNYLLLVEFDMIKSKI
jgi:hypothetical protein